MKRFNVMARKYAIMKAEEEKKVTEEEIKALRAAEKALLNETGSMPVDFLSIEPAQWPDSGMGWPEPGKSYAQVITEGYRIRVSSAGKLFECRVAGDVARCMAIKG